MSLSLPRQDDNGLSEFELSLLSSLVFPRLLRLRDEVRARELDLWCFLSSREEVRFDESVL